jgi:hypothetical protein
VGIDRRREIENAAEIHASIRSTKEREGIALRDCRLGIAPQGVEAMSYAIEDDQIVVGA